MEAVPMSIAIAIMTKTPGHSPVKTRLAATHGTELATEMHRRMAAATASVVALAASESGLHPYWAIAESTAAAASGWPDFEVIHQQGEALGQRMASVHGALLLHHSAVILVGTDSPQLQPGWLMQAGTWLADDSPRTVLGPADDGGFWLFGGNRAIPIEDWDSIQYSQATTLDAFARMATAHGDLLMLDPLTDVDAADDVAALGSGLRNLPAPTPVQGKLLEWIEGFGR